MGSDYHHTRRTQQVDNYSGSPFDIDNVKGNVEFSSYTVHAPPTPDNQPLEIFIHDRTGSDSIFAGHHELTQANSQESGNSRKGSWSDERDFNFYSDGYREANGTGDGVVTRQELPDRRNPLSGLQRALSAAKQSLEEKNVSVNHQIEGFNDSEWLFESKGSYGYGSAWHKEDTDCGDADSIGGGTKAFIDKRRRPLTRAVKISAAILSPYRLLIFVRMIALVSFMLWRALHPNEDAYALWGVSVACEIWFSFCWILEQLPKLCPINRYTDLDVLKEKFESPDPSNPTGKSDLPGIDIVVSLVDSEVEPPLVTANTVLSILAADYPVEKLSCYVSDDGGALITFEAMAETASFAGIWVPFCRKHEIEPRNPESYFKLKIDPYKDKVQPDFVRDRRRVKREYDEFKVRINGLFNSIRRRSDTYNTREEVRILKQWREKNDDEPIESLKIPKATWMPDGTHWPGTWPVPAPDHSRGEHASIIQVMLNRPGDEPLQGAADDASFLDLTKVDIRLPMLVYVSREKRAGYDHNRKAGAMNALLRASAILSNGAFILNLDSSSYIYNSQALREGMCFMMDCEGDRICYVQFPLRFEGIDPSGQNANSNTVFFDINMRALDGVQGPMYVGTGCLFRRTALYGFDPPRLTEPTDCSCCCFPHRRKKVATISSDSESNQGVTFEDTESLRRWETDDEEMNIALITKKFGNSSLFSDSILVAAYEGLPIADPPSANNGRPPGALTISRQPLDASTVAEAIDAISCWYEDKSEWGKDIGWIYGSTEDVITGYRMHKRGWKSVYCVTKIDAFRGTAPINLTDRLHQFLHSATGSIEIFFSRNNAILGGSKLKLQQRIAYLNCGLSPFTSIFLTVYCFIPAISLFTNQFIVESLNITFLAHLLIITMTFSIIAALEIKWSGVALEEWWRNEQLWLIKGTSAHLAAVLHGLLNVFSGIELSSTSTSKSTNDDNDDDQFADPCPIKWTFLMLPPLIIIMVNLIALAVAVFRTMYSTNPKWSPFLGGAVFCIWVLVHLFPFAKGLNGKRGKTPTVVYVWAGLVSISLSLLWVAIKPPSGNSDIVGSFQFL